ncbi:MAG: AMP-binding protein [Solirubrobacteraceae bacterium]
MRVSQQVTIDAPPGAVWELIGAPLMYPRFLRDIRRWEAIQGDDDGRPRYRIEVRVGDVELGAAVEFTRSIAPRELSWQSVEGIEHSGHWHVSEQHEGRCRVSLELNYRAPEGLLGTVADAAALPLLRSGARESLVRLMAIVEGHPPARGTLAKQLAQSAREIGWDASAFARSGMIAPARPDRLVRAAWELTQWDATLAAGCTIAATMHPDEPALIDDRGRWTFGEVHQRTNALVRELNGRGVEPGDRVAILCRNHERVAEAIVAASKLGADIVLLNAGLSARQLRELLKRERPRALIHDDEPPRL